MKWDEQAREGMDVALNEAEVLGLRLGESGAWCDLLVHVVALPEHGPLGSDRRRILRLLEPGHVTVLLRTDQAETSGYGDAIPLASLEEVEAFFASLTRSDTMYGWSFLDHPAPPSDWPAEPSLTVKLRGDDAPHSLYWFNECGRDDAAYCIEGVVTFDDIEVLRADGTPEPLDEFVADGARYWQALNANDERLDVDAQTAAMTGTPTWRPYAGVSVTVSGTNSPGD